MAKIKRHYSNAVFVAFGVLLMGLPALLELRVRRDLFISFDHEGLGQILQTEHTFDWRHQKFAKFTVSTNGKALVFFCSEKIQLQGNNVSLLLNAEETAVTQKDCLSEKRPRQIPIILGFTIAFLCFGAAIYMIFTGKYGD